MSDPKASLRIVEADTRNGHVRYVGHRQGLPPYQKYKSSGVEWLGDAPEHWEVVPVKRHYDVRLGRVLQADPKHPSDRQVAYLKARHVQWFEIHATDLPRMWASPDDMEYFSIRKGDLLVCEGGEGGRSAVVKEIAGRQIIQNALHRVRPRDGSSNLWLQYVLSVAASAGLLEALNSKVTIAHFTVDKFNALMIPMPPPAEVNVLVTYLAAKTAKIDTLIDKIRTLIEHLQEKRRTLITETTIRGLPPDPCQKLKPSGVEWLGDVPEHWEVVPVKRHYDVRLGRVLQADPKHPSDRQVAYLKARHVQWFEIHATDLPRMWASPDDMEYFSIRKGDLLVCEGGEGGRSAVVKEIAGRQIIQNALHRVRPRDGSSNLWLQYVLSVAASAGLLEALNSKVTIAHFTVDKFNALMIPMPPPAEVNVLVTYLAAKTVKIDGLIDKNQVLIDRLREKRQALITAAVTGQIDVRSTQEDETA